MSVTWWAFPAQARADVTLVEPYTFDEWESAMSGILETPDLQAEFCLLVDRRRSKPPSSDFVERMVKYLRDHEARLSRARAAVLVSSVAAMAAGRAVETLTDLRVGNFRLRTFYGILEAEAWLRTGDSLVTLDLISQGRAGAGPAAPPDWQQLKP